MVEGSGTCVVLILCAAVLFLVVMLLLRLTGVNWMLSILGGTPVVVMYIALNFAIRSLLSTLIKGWLWA